MTSAKTTAASAAACGDAGHTGSSAPVGGLVQGEVVVAVLLFICACAAFLELRPPGGTPGQRALAVALFVLLAGIYLGFGVGALPAWLRGALHGRAARAAVGPIALFVVVAAYSAATGAFAARDALVWGAYFAVPALLVVVRGATPQGSFPAKELAAAVVLGAPIKFHLLPALPLGGGARALDAARLVALAAGMWLFLVAWDGERDDVGYRWSVRGRDLRDAVVAWAAFAVLAVPAGLGMHFLAWHPRVTFSSAVVSPVVIYLVTALPEEFLFRGLIQNLCVRWRGARWGLAIGSVVFGLSHLPDPRYAALATLAGVAYGWVWARSARITASAVTHALVDATWVALLRA